MKAARFGAALAMTAALAAPAGASAQADKAQAQRQAYGYAMRCFIANGVVVSDMRSKNQPTLADTQEAKARRSFDMAVKLGGTLGYSGSRINQDLGLAQADELPKLVTDFGYFQKTAATCKTLGLM